MKQLAKYIFTFLLCILITVPVCLSFMTYYQQLRVIKKEVKKELIAQTPHTDLVSFTFSMDQEDFQDLVWHHGHEFEFNEKMFDIVEADTIGNIVHFLCFPDKQETALNAKFKKQLLDRYANDQDKKNRSIQISSIFLSLYTQNTLIKLPKIVFQKMPSMAELTFNYIEPSLKGLVPPPKQTV